MKTLEDLIKKLKEVREDTDVMISALEEGCISPTTVKGFFWTYDIVGRSLTRAVEELIEKHGDEQLKLFKFHES
jgi:hypothetical protein